MCQNRKPHSQLLDEGGETGNSIELELALAQISSAVDIASNLKNYLLLLKQHIISVKVSTPK